MNLFTFVVSDPGTHTIETVLGSNPDTVLLLNGDHGLIAENDNKSSTDKGSRIVVSLDAGIYFVGVRSASLTQTGAYQISVSHQPR